MEIIDKAYLSMWVMTICMILILAFCECVVSQRTFRKLHLVFGIFICLLMAGSVLELLTLIWCRGLLPG